MKRYMLLGFALCAAFLVNAQKVYFIYLQTEDASPFFVKMDNQVYSSNYSGYLILSNLKDSTYSFSVGPVPAGSKEPQFTIPLKGNDKGYLIKSFKDYTGLFDLQQLSIVKPNETVNKSTGSTKFIRRTDAFSVMLAMSIGDSTLLITPVTTVAVAETKKSETESPKTELKDSVLSTQASKTVAVLEKPAKKEDSVMTSQVVSAPEIIKADSVMKDIALNTAIKQEAGAQAEVKKDSVLPIATQEVAAKIEEVKPEVKEEAYKKSVVVKRSESSTTEGFGLVFFDKRGEETDTIRLVIPNPKVVFASAEPKKEEHVAKQEEIIKKPVDTTTQIGIATIPEKKEEVGDQKPDSSMAKPNTVLPVEKSETALLEQKTDTIAAVKIKVAEKAPVTYSCKAVATDNDFFKVRKNMASRDSDEDMIAEAKKLFKSRCFSTEQVRNLSALFLTPGGKYQFFDAAYTHVSDPQNFASLQTEIKDDYNLKRFKALLGE